MNPGSRLSSRGQPRWVAILYLMEGHRREVRALPPHERQETCNNRQSIVFQVSSFLMYFFFCSSSGLLVIIYLKSFLQNCLFILSYTQYVVFSVQRVLFREHEETMLIKTMYILLFSNFFWGKKTNYERTKISKSGSILLVRYKRKRCGPGCLFKVLTVINLSSLRCSRILGGGAAGGHSPSCLLPILMLIASTKGTDTK